MAATEGQYDATAMADTFEFVGPVVGPLTKDQFLTAIGSFNLKVSQAADTKHTRI
jgi:hypothetical protein